MAESLTIGDLAKAKAITRDKIDTAVGAISTDPDLDPFRMGGCYVLDLTAAVGSHLPAAPVIAASDRPEDFRRTMARTAIPLATPEKA